VEEVILLVIVVVGLPYLLSIVALVKASRLRRRLDEIEWRMRHREPLQRLEPKQPEPVQPVPAPVLEQPPTPVAPPPIVEEETAPVPVVPGLLPSPRINLEQFMGAQLFAWLGGFVLFLALIFFLKYAFENHLISPELQVAMEYLVALGVLVAGVVLTRKRALAVLAQTLAATGVLMLYSVTFAMHAYYHLTVMPVTFGIMALVTAAAFALAVRLEAQVIAILGLLGGFLTPVLLSTGRDQPLGLFGYIGLLNLGLMAILRRRPWNCQLLLAAAGTVIMQVLWADAHFTVAKLSTAMLILLSMEALFIAGFVATQRDGQTNPWISVAALLPAVAALCFALGWLKYATIAAAPGKLFGFMLLADLGLLSLALLRPRLFIANHIGGGLTFLTLAIWTAGHVTPELLYWALGAYFVFALLHAVFPVVLERWRGPVAPLGWAHLFPALALALVMIPILKLPELSFAVWICVLLLDFLVFVLALMTASVLAIIGALLLTLAATGIWILRVPAVMGGLSEMLVVIGGFAVVFFVLGIFAARKLRTPKLTLSAEVINAHFRGFAALDVRAQISSLAVLLPFVLLVFVVVRLPLSEPSPVFGMALLLTVLLLGVARVTSVDPLALVGMLATLALQVAWFNTRFAASPAPGVSLAWHIGFAAVYTIFPFLCRRAFAERLLPWVVGALAVPLHFWLIYRVADAAFRNPYMGLIPAAFALPALAGLVFVTRNLPANAPSRTAALACWGGAALFFITLIFPIQFERQWITTGWALEGAALLWLRQRITHKGLTVVGTGLLAVAFARLALNPAVLEYHARTATPLWNWYLYAYGTVALCQFLGACWNENRRATAALATMGVVLLFLLVNIEIADYFTPVGRKSLVFEFTGNFARDMTYSIAWALFAFALLVAGIWKRVRPARYAAIALLVVTLAKLFLHDLANLKQLYRIGAFVGVAVVLLLASFAYQRFAAAEKETP